MDNLTFTLRRINTSTNDEAKQATANFRRLDATGKPATNGVVSMTMDPSLIPPAGDYVMTLTPVSSVPVPAAE